MMDQAVGRLAAATIAVGLAVTVWGATDLARSKAAFQPWFALVLLAIGIALVLSGVITLVVLVLRAKGQRGVVARGSYIDIGQQDSIALVSFLLLVEGGPRAPLNQYLRSQPCEWEPVTIWAGRPRTIGEGFVGRGRDLESISGALETHDAVVISGGAGSGKSRLAAEYTHQSGVRGFWTAAGGSVVETLVGLAGTLGLRLVERTDEEIAGEVQRRLAELPPETLWVVDNLGDLELVNGLLGVSGNVRLLVTTRDSRRHLLPPTVAYHWTEVLRYEAAIDLLRSRSDAPPDHPVLARIAENAGHLPLALEVLAVQLGRPPQTPESVLAQFDRAHSAIAMDAFQEGSGASIPRTESVFAAIAGTLEDLGADDRRSLAGLGYIADAPMPDALAAALTGLEDDTLAGLLSRCSRLSILSWNGGQIRFHDLTLGALEATNPVGSLDVALARAHSRLASINTDHPVALRSELVHYEALHSHARERLGPEEEAVLAFQNSLAIGYSTAGRIEDAMRLDEQALKATERVLGPEHPDTLASRSNLAAGYRDAGRIEDAMRLWEQALEVMERVLGPDHPDTLGSRSNLAAGYRDAGRTEDAMRLWEQTLDARERVLGPEHPDTLASCNNLANGYHAAGLTQDAIRLNEQTLEMRERVLGPEHPDTLTSRNNLAAGYHAAGRTEVAIMLWEQALGARE